MSSSFTWHGAVFSQRRPDRDGLAVGGLGVGVSFFNILEQTSLAVAPSGFGEIL